MVKKLFKFLFLFMMVLLLIFISCNQPSSSSGDDDDDNDNDNDLPVQTIIYQNDGNGFIQFYTNDSQYYGVGYYDYKIATNEVTMTTVEVQTKKLSGASNYGYGVIFCVQNNDNFYRILITINGSYQIVKKVGGVYSSIHDWSNPGLINTGYNQINTIKITYDEGNNFSVYLNNTFVIGFIDTTFTGGQSGFYTGIGTPTGTPTESFPNTPVDVRFKMLQPVVQP